MTNETLEKKMKDMAWFFNPPLQIKEISDFCITKEKQNPFGYIDPDKYNAYLMYVDKLSFVQYATKKDIKQEIVKCNSLIEEYMQENRQTPSIFLEFRIEDQALRKSKLQNKLKFFSQKRDGNDIARAKTRPISDYIEFVGGFACCPFHNEKTGSFKYYPRNNRAYCFGGCGNKDVIDVVMTLNNCTLPEALKIILL